MASRRPGRAKRGNPGTQPSSSTRPGSWKNARSRSKLVKLKEVLTEHGIFKDPKMKLLIFTEHKDTLDYLAGDGKDGRPWASCVSGA